MVYLYVIIIRCCSQELIILTFKGKLNGSIQLAGLLLREKVPYVSGKNSSQFNFSVDSWLVGVKLRFLTRIFGVFFVCSGSGLNLSTFERKTLAAESRVTL